MCIFYALYLVPSNSLNRCDSRVLHVNGFTSSTAVVVVVRRMTRACSIERVPSRVKVNVCLMLSISSYAKY